MVFSLITFWVNRQPSKLENPMSSLPVVVWVMIILGNPTLPLKGHVEDISILTKSELAVPPARIAPPMAKHF
jgi:hypothetical protein